MASKSKRRISPAEFVASLTTSEKSAIRKAWRDGLLEHSGLGSYRSLTTRVKRKAESVLPLIKSIRQDCIRLGELHTEQGEYRNGVFYARAPEIDTFIEWLSKVELGWRSHRTMKVERGRQDYLSLYAPITRVISEIAKRHGIRVTVRGVFPRILDATGKALCEKWRAPDHRTFGRVLQSVH